MSNLEYPVFLYFLLDICSLHSSLILGQPHGARPRSNNNSPSYDSSNFATKPTISDKMIRSCEDDLIMFGPEIAIFDKRKSWPSNITESWDPKHMPGDSQITRT